MSTLPTTDGVVVVRVRDQVNRTLAGHDGREYTSPPHERADALALVALLLGRTPESDDDGTEQNSWSCPLAGGQRTITLDPAPGQPATTSGNEPVIRPPRPALAGSAAAAAPHPAGQPVRRGVGP